MCNKWIFFFIGLGASLIAYYPGLSWAVDENLHVALPEGLYGEIGGGLSTMHGESYSHATVEKQDSGLGGYVGIGYKLVPYFAIEGGFIRYARVRIHAPSDHRIAEDRRFSGYAAAKGIYPVLCATGLELFAKVGAQYLESKTHIINSGVAQKNNLKSGHRQGYGLHLGMGASYVFVPECLGQIQWMHGMQGHHRGNMDLYTIGLSFIIN